MGLLCFFGDAVPVLRLHQICSAAFLYLYNIALAYCCILLLVSRLFLGCSTSICLEMDSESELRNLSELETKLGEVMFSFSDIVPENLREWFTVYSSSHGTTRELLLLSVLTSTNALVGKTVVEVFSTYEERANLFLIAIAPSGSGKTPACHLGCTDPVVSYLERKIDMALLLDETSANGLFNHYVSSPLVPIICVDEAHTFLTKMACPSKSSQVHLSMERLCKLFDGDFWYVLKGNKSKGSGVPSAMASLQAFTTPRQFLEKVWPKILSAENGLAERVHECSSMNVINNNFV